ncbi:MAG: BREX-1 system phosphatase PglZ type B [Desulfomonilaceae bacterium]
MRIIDSLIGALRASANYSSDVQVAPFCIIWPDKDRQFECVIPRIQIELPELFVLGDYNPLKRVGPSIWLRCVLARTLEEPRPDPEKTPIFYLPSVSKQDLRAVENCPDEIKPLAELQYRGSFWSQKNGKDWTILAFVKKHGLDVASDKATVEAMASALGTLLHQSVESLRGKRIDEVFFNDLLLSGDLIRDILKWLNAPEQFRSGLNQNQWKAFLKKTKSDYQFHPEKDGPITGAERLAQHDGPWEKVWARFCEAPKLYPNIPELIRKNKPPENMFADLSGWPQCNELEEKRLRQELLSTIRMTPSAAGELILKLESDHKHRCEFIWAKLGESPLAMALEWLAKLAETTTNRISAGSLDEATEFYSSNGWYADDAVVKALSKVDKQQDVEAVANAIRAVYTPWAEEAARFLQKLFSKSPYPAKNQPGRENIYLKDGVCVFFVDGLRFDLGKRLSELLRQSGFVVSERLNWSALPTVTATGKPAVSPVSNHITGLHVAADFEPCVAATGHVIKGGHHLEKLLAENGWVVLKKNETGDGKGKAWLEFGDIDHEGHDKGWKLAKYLDNLLDEIVDKIVELLDSGWRSVHIVTDHGWLLLPGGLPHVALHPSLVENKWGRCATIKSGALTEQNLFPWHWNPDVLVALADGISCYKNGQEYSHGGLSFQECLTVELTVTPSKTAETIKGVIITETVWRGLRLNVTLGGNSTGLKLDVRLQPGNPDSTVTHGGKPFKEDGKVSVVVENEDYEGTAAAIVVLDTNDQLLAQITTVIGGV